MDSRVLWVFLVLVAAPAAARVAGRDVSSSHREARSLQGFGPWDGPRAGDGEVCTNSLAKPSVFCIDGFYCDLNLTAPSDLTSPSVNPDSILTLNGTCRAFNQTGSLVNFTAALGEACSVGLGVGSSVLCQSGLFCDFAALLQGGLTSGQGIVLNGTCQALPNVTWPQRPELADAGEPCSVGGALPVRCMRGLFCNATLPPPGLGLPAARNGTCLPLNASTGAEGEPCLPATNGTESCQAGLVCDSRKPRPGSWADDIMGFLDGLLDGGSSDGFPNPGSSDFPGMPGMFPNPLGRRGDGFGGGGHHGHGDHGGGGPGLPGGICRRPGGHGQPCLVANTTGNGSSGNGTGSDWTWSCAGGLVCLVIDPGATMSPLVGMPPPGGPDGPRSRLSLGAGADMDWGLGWPFRPGFDGDWGSLCGTQAGFCVNASEVPPVVPGAPPGSLGSPCNLSASSNVTGACSEGLTCVSTTANSTIALPTGADGVCANSSSIVTAINAENPTLSSPGSDSIGGATPVAGTPGAPSAPGSPNSSAGDRRSAQLMPAIVLFFVVLLL